MFVQIDLIPSVLKSLGQHAGYVLIGVGVVRGIKVGTDAHHYP